MRSSNPALSSRPFSGFGFVSEQASMTLSGTVHKSLLLLACVFLPALWVWLHALKGDPGSSFLGLSLYGGMLGGFVLSLVTIFKKEWAPLTAPLYAVAEGFFLGAISLVFQQAYPGIVFQAVCLTFVTFFVMLLLYQNRVLQATDQFRTGVIGATLAIALFYLISWGLSFFGVPVSLIQGHGFLSVAFSVFVVGIAALNFILDFDLIERGTRSGVPRYMEWYGAFALMITLVWLYLEMLRLLAKLSDRR